MRLSWMSRILIIGETLDLLTTVIGFIVGHIEGNPLMASAGIAMPIMKLAGTIFMVYLLERAIGKFDGQKLLVMWIFPAIACFPIFWNMIKILT